MLSDVGPSFPLSEYDLLLEQNNFTLNILRPSRTNPKLSDYGYIFGEFNFLATLLAPSGTQITFQIHPDKEGSWELNGEV